MHYLNKIILVVFLFQAAQAQETIIIKKYKRPSRTILDRKIIHMNMGEQQSFTKPEALSGFSNLTRPQVKKVIKAKKSFQVKKLKKKTFSIAKLPSKKTNNETNEGYKEEDWEDFVTYQELDEDLNVKAKLLTH